MLISPQPFLDSLFEEISKAGLDISNLPLDHIAYQADSSEEYNTLKPLFSDLGKIVHEEIVGGRRVSIYTLLEPLTYKTYKINVLELIEPKKGQVCESSFQHIEFVADKPFEEIMTLYPQLNWDTSSMNRSKFSHLKLHFDNGLTLKFLQQPILEIVADS